MQAKNVLYAAVGAQVVVARKVSDQVSAFSGRVSEETANYTKTAEKTIDGWASEGEKFVNKVSEGKVAEEISSKVDLDQAKEQVSKLRAQLEGHARHVALIVSTREGRGSQRIGKTKRQDHRCQEASRQKAGYQKAGYQKAGR